MIDHAESWRLQADRAIAAVTIEGGHVGPVTFDLGGRQVEPMHVAPWAGEQLDASLPPMLRHLRGDFFCLPFGEGEPPHGTTANDRWTLQRISDDGRRLDASMQLAGDAEITKTVSLVDGQTVVYQRHTTRGLTGPQCFGHHAMLHFPDAGEGAHVSVSPFIRGQVAPQPIEVPPAGRSALQSGALFDDLRTVPRADGGMADLSRYPVRPGYEDIVQVFADPTLDLAWSAVSLPSRGYCWFSLRDPRVLTGTLLWHSNGGRLYPPWNGRHRNVLGIEDVTSYFHLGREASVVDNPATAAGQTTALPGDLDVRTLWGVAAIDEGFGRVVQIATHPGHITMTDHTGRSVRTSASPDFLATGLVS